MNYKTIVAVLPNQKAGARVLAEAIPLAEKFGSHLIGVHAEPGPAAYATPVGFPEAGLIEASVEESKKRSDALHTFFETKTGPEGISVEWRGVESFLGDSAVSALTSARCADLVIAPQEDPDDKGATNDLEALIFESGRPVVFVPYAGKVPGQVDNILIAWNGTRESARAVFDAMPFIINAKKVEIFTVDPKTNGDQSAPLAGAEIATALARHGANVTVETQISDGVPAGAIIENRLADTGADMLIMGAYSHSRWTERLFGGVTRTVLKSMPALTFMSR